MGAEGIERVKEITMKQMEDLIKGLNDGSVYFTDCDGMEED